jgi:hypothetical protein
MTDVLTFWLDNKHASGAKIAQHVEQTLVSYRERYYVVVNGSALMKGGKALRYSRTTLPGVWKKILAGSTPPVEPSPALNTDGLINPPVTRKIRVKKEQEVRFMPEVTPVVSNTDMPLISAKRPAEKPPKAPRKSDGKPAAQTAVSAECPYCHQKHEVPVEKGRSGKPFFLTCTKCQNEFAVRLVQVTMYQAQVAGFQ